MITSVGCGRLLPERGEGRVVQNISECVVHQTVVSDGGTTDFCQRASPLLLVVVVVVVVVVVDSRADSLLSYSILDE